MGEVYIFDSIVAERLGEAGYIYSLREIDGQFVYVFYETNSLIQELASTYSQYSYTVKRTVYL